MKFWWVNHKQTSEQEIAGGYLWSPVVERDGKFSQYYYNMRLARAGDSVVSYSHGALGALGTVTDGAILAPRPEEFGTVGANWADIGWLLPTKWVAIPQLRPKDFLSEIAHLLPSKYSPIRAKDGNGNQKAYLSEISASLFNAIRFRAGGTVPPQLDATITDQSLRDALENATEQRIMEDTSLSATEKEQLCKARRGQGLFRQNLFGIENSCKVTGIKSPTLLIASHIKPWRSCADSTERLDGSNGLLLAPHADFLFDRGLISFSHEGDLLVSPILTEDNRDRLHLPSTLTCTFSSKQLNYLEYHRDVIFQS